MANKCCEKGEIRFGIGVGVDLYLVSTDKHCVDFWNYHSNLTRTSFKYYLTQISVRACRDFSMNGGKSFSIPKVQDKVRFSNAVMQRRKIGNMYFGCMFLKNMLP